MKEHFVRMLALVAIVLCFSWTLTPSVLANGNINNSVDNFWTTFAQPYQNAVNILAYETLKPLADAPIPVGSADAHQLIHNSKANLQRFYNILEPMRAASEELRQQQDQRVTNKTLELQLLENDLQDTEQKINNATTDLNEKKRLLTDAQTQLAREISSLEDANRLLRSREDALHDAKNCIWRSKRSLRVRRFGGFLKKVAHGVGHVASQVGHGVGHVAQQVGRGTEHVVQQTGHGLNHVGGQLEKGGTKLVGHVRDLVNIGCPLWAGVKSARAAVRSAETNVANQRQRVTNAQANVNSVQATVDQLQQIKTQKEQQKQILNNHIADMRVTLEMLSRISVKVKQVVLYLASLFDVGQTLQSIIRKMVDMAELLEPLQEISTLVGSFGGQNTTALLQATESTRQSMLVLKDKLPQYPLLDVA
ncbi:uncharacterized protein LOC129587791 [Paramacrobiotus metropolitanus]|uniref:uncharacterized protein LOC129587791 n=1 Tax=Paramacrobiotus metropolitanus TaxID=2943436 RepID=UPI0024457341|nr:uncharacterized protein LOC129587791 [Paramacrobiotus metropolitanus]